MGVDGQRWIRLAGHAITCCQPRISSTARPAIMWVDAFVPGPVMICGITEASATRKPETPCTRSSGSTTASLSTPILHVPTACPKLAEASRASSRISSGARLRPWNEFALAHTVEGMLIPDVIVLFAVRRDTGADRCAVDPNQIAEVIQTARSSAAPAAVANAAHRLVNLVVDGW
jgi:hypothetical protein